MKALKWIGYVLAISGLIMLVYNAYMYLFVSNTEYRALGGIGVLCTVFGAIMIRKSIKS